MNHYKKINQIAFPLLANGILGLLIGLINQSMIARISVEAFGAIGAVHGLLFTLAGVFGMSAVAFHIYASKNGEQLQEYFRATLFLSIAIGVLAAILLYVFQKPLLIFIYRFDGRVLEYATEYLAIMSLYLAIQLPLFVFSSFFKIIKKTKWIFICSTFAALLTVCLNYVLILGNLGFRELGARGAALATIISLSIQLSIYVYLCRKELKLSLPAAQQLKLLLKESIPLVGQEILEGSLFVIVIQGMIARIGNLELAGYLLVMPIVNVTLISMYMYGAAVITLVGENKQPSALKNIPRTALKMTMILFVGLSSLFLMFRYDVAGFISPDLDLVQYAASILLLTLLANLLSPVQNIYKSALQAIGQSRFVLVSTFMVNLFAFLMMLLLNFVWQPSFFWILLGIFINHGLLSTVLFVKYRKVVLLKDNEGLGDDCRECNGSY